MSITPSVRTIAPSTVHFTPVTSYVFVFTGSYDTPEKLTEILNQLTTALEIPRLKNKKLFSFDQINKKFSLTVHDLWITLIIKKQLVNILGLQLKHYIPSQVAFIGLSKSGDFFEKDKVKYMYKEPELTWETDDKNGGECPFSAQMVTVSSFLVYSNIVKKSLIGSTYTNSLRHVSIKGNYGEQIIETFNNRFYYPVISSTVPYIEISIRSIGGEPINFQSGSFFVLLHFRKV